MKVRCHITVKDIREATCLLASNQYLLASMNCPVARAVNRKLKPKYRCAAVLTYVEIIFLPNNIRMRTPLSKNMTRWINQYDRVRFGKSNEEARPTNFTIDIPSMYVRNEETK